MRFRNKFRFFHLALAKRASAHDKARALKVELLDRHVAGNAADTARLSYDRTRRKSRHDRPVERATKRLTIVGTVQGVGFRYFVQRKARALGVTGWVRNRVDGSVEAVIQGNPEAVEALIALARTGPSSARVTNVSVRDADGLFTAFDQLPTA